jgi:hypothetical protein
MDRRAWQGGSQTVEMLMAKRGLYDNVNAKRARIKAGSGERMRKAGSKGAPSDAAWKQSAKTAKKRKKR